VKTRRSEFFSFELEQNVRVPRVINGDLLVTDSFKLPLASLGPSGEFVAQHGSHDSHQSGHASHSSHTSSGGR
jgi:hypothetical protein